MSSKKDRPFESRIRLFFSTKRGVFKGPLYEPLEQSNCYLLHITEEPLEKTILSLLPFFLSPQTQISPSTFKSRKLWLQGTMSEAPYRYAPEEITQLLVIGFAGPLIVSTLVAEVVIAPFRRLSRMEFPSLLCLFPQCRFHSLWSQLLPVLHLHSRTCKERSSTDQVMGLDLVLVQ